MTDGERLVSGFAYIAQGKNDAVIKKLEKFAVGRNHIILQFWGGDGLVPRGWTIYLKADEMEISGEGKTLSEAYENALKNKEELCSKFPG